MPTYAYECEACGHTFELFQSMTASVKRKCPECGKNKLQRLIGKGAVESIARQPEATGPIGTNMILAAALVEGATLFAVVVGLLAAL